MRPILIARQPTLFARDSPREPRWSRFVRSSSRGHRLRRRTVEDTQNLVKRIALGRRLARRSDQVENLVEAQSLCSVGTGFMVDLLANHGALEIVHAERERCLREKGRDHDPVRLDVLEVIEEEAADREIAQIVEARRCCSLSSKLDAKLVVI